MYKITITSKTSCCNEPRNYETFTTTLSAAKTVISNIIDTIVARDDELDNVTVEVIN